MGAKPGKCHIVSRATIYSDVVQLYEKNKIVEQYPVNVSFSSESALDFGGVCRDMYSAFWEECYKSFFDGASLLVPLLQCDFDAYHILGQVMSHGYLVCGHLPVRIALPILITALLGPANVKESEIPTSIFIEAFMDYISITERKTITLALECKEPKFDVQMQSDVLSILSRFACRKMVNPNNLTQLITLAAKYEFYRKPVAITTLIHNGIPNIQKVFWKDLGIEGISNFLVVSADKLLKVLTSECTNEAQETIFGYIKCMIGNMQSNEIRNFVRFCTGSSVMSEESITVCFNSTSGLARRPCSNTCGCVLMLSICYENYDDFVNDWLPILTTNCSDVNHKPKQQLITLAAKYEFYRKPVAITTLIHNGIPNIQKVFWKDLGIEGISKLYNFLVVSADKLLKVLTSECTNEAKETIFGYLKCMIGKQ